MLTMTMMKRKEFNVTLMHKEHFVLVQMHVEIDPFGISRCVNVCRFRGIDWQTKPHWIFTCIRTHVRTRTCMYILSIEVNEKRWWIHARCLCLCRCWRPFCSQLWVLWVLVTQWLFPLWPLTMGLAVWWKKGCGKLPFQTGETLTTSDLLHQFIKQPQNLNT